MSKINVESVKLVKKKSLGRGNYVFDLASFSWAKNIRPGQFVHIRLPGTNILFRRAFSIYDYDPGKGEISIIFKVFGRGTSLMAGMEKGAELDVMGPLGNGFRPPSKKSMGCPHL